MTETQPSNRLRVIIIGAEYVFTVLSSPAFPLISPAHPQCLSNKVSESLVSSWDSRSFSKSTSVSTSTFTSMKNHPKSAGPGSRTTIRGAHATSPATFTSTHSRQILIGRGCMSTPASSSSSFKRLRWCLCIRVLMKSVCWGSYATSLEIQSYLKAVAQK